MLQGGVALELMEMLKPAMPGNECSISRFPGKSDDFAEAEETSRRVMDLVIWLRNVDQPGEVFLNLLGLHGNPRETGFFNGWSSRDIHTQNAVWRRFGGKVHYYTLGDAAKARTTPFDEFGPFPDVQSMRDAMERLAVRFPEMVIASRKGGQAEELITDAALNLEYGQALEKLAALGA
ncbi:hypothetical protein D9M69_539780 [compost metagenome]